MPSILTPEQAADHLQVSRRTVYTLLRQGKLPGKKIGGSWRLSTAALEEFLRHPDPQPPAPQASSGRPRTSRTTRVLK